MRRVGRGVRAQFRAGKKIGGARSLFLDPKAKSHDPIGKLHSRSIHNARNQDGVRYFTLQNVHVVYNTTYELSCTRVLHSFTVYRNHKPCIALWIS